jgi:prepilin-type N-terminal cleavage/methylation domain-containing protein
MRKLKQSAGFTLVEVLVSLSLLAMVMWVAGGAVYMASDSYGITARMQDDEYAARIAMLNISRELHRGWHEVEYTPAMPHDDDGDGDPEYYDDAWLKLSGLEGAEITYTFNRQIGGAGKLTRAINAGASPVAFDEIGLKGFVIEVEGFSADPDGHFKIKEDYPGFPRLKITLACENGLEVATKVALLRIPPIASSRTGP